MASDKKNPQRFWMWVAAGGPIQADGWVRIE